VKRDVELAWSGTEKRRADGRRRVDAGARPDESIHCHPNRDERSRSWVVWSLKTWPLPVMGERSLGTVVIPACEPDSERYSVIRSLMPGIAATMRARCRDVWVTQLANVSAIVASLPGRALYLMAT
jgi:hypothetical protein